MTICVTLIKCPGGFLTRIPLTRFLGKFEVHIVKFALFICVRNAIKTGELGMIDNIKSLEFLLFYQSLSFQLWDLIEQQKFLVT